MPPGVNPFIHARVLSPEESIDRVEGRRLLELAAGGHNAVLHAPRRFGKTTLLKQVLQSASELDMPGVLVDLSDVLSVADVAARLEQAFRALPGNIQRLISKELGSVAITTPIAGFSFSRRNPPADPIAAAGALNCGVLKILKNSLRNSRWRDSDFPKEKFFIREIVESASMDRSGFVEYKWFHPTTKEWIPKITYFEVVDDLILCSAIYW